LAVEDQKVINALFNFQLTYSDFLTRVNDYMSAASGLQDTVPEKNPIVDVPVEGVRDATETLGNFGIKIFGIRL